MAESLWTVPVDDKHVLIDTGREGCSVTVEVGSPFVDAVKAAAKEAGYGSNFRVFLGREEIHDPKDAPGQIETGMHISLSSYDKVGL